MCYPSENSPSRALQGKIQGACFQQLDAPVMATGSENVPTVPLNALLEETMVPSVEKAKKSESEDQGNAGLLIKSVYILSPIKVG